MSNHNLAGRSSLDARLAALPRELPPARDLWPGIDAALAGPTARRRRPAYTLAAVVAVAALGALISARIARDAAPPGADARTTGSGPVMAATRPKRAQEAGYESTRVALEQTYRERLLLLAPDTRARIEQDLALIRAAHEDIRGALARDPDSRLLTELLQSTVEQEFNLYSTVGRNTEPFAPRSRT